MNLTGDDGDGDDDVMDDDGDDDVMDGPPFFCIGPPGHSQPPTSFRFLCVCVHVLACDEFLIEP